MNREELIELAKQKKAEQDAKLAAAYKKYNTPAIARKDLVHGAYYKGHCRNAEVARWNEDRGCFVHWRIKFGDRFTEEIKHPEDEKRYDVFVVKERIDNPVEEIPLK